VPTAVETQGHMVDELWDKALERLFSCKSYTGLKQVLEYCRPEKNNNVLVLKTPGRFEYMLRKPEGIAILQEEFKVGAVRFEPDEELKKAFQALAQQPATPTSPSALEERASAATGAPVMTYKRAEQIIANILTYFGNADNLSQDNHPDKNPYKVTPANGLAYRTVKRLLNSFPDPPGETPLLVHAKIGMGKTHLLQSFAWQLADKISQARDLFRTQDVEGGRKLLELGDVPPETVLRKLEKAARARIRCINGEEFTREHILSTNKDAWKGREGNADTYKQEREVLYDTLDVLFFDDLHALARGGKQSTLEYAYKVVNRLYNARKAVISAVDTSPKLLLERIKDSGIRQDFERVLSRCYEGGIIEIEDPAKEDLVDVINTHLHHMNPQLGAVTIDDLKNGTFFSVAKSYRDALSVANTAYKFTLEGLSVDKAIANGIRALKETRAASGDLF